ncbi:MAG: hypothetical protein AAGD18_24355 [Actinomycetota bacterium]
MSPQSHHSPRPGRRPPLRLLATVVTLLGVWIATQALGSTAPTIGTGPLTVDDSGHWFEYSTSGEPYFMAGSGGPEGFLYYEPSRQQEIVDELIEHDVRAIYVHVVRAYGGDGGGDEHPFVDADDPGMGVDAALLDTWDGLLSQLDEAGIVTWMHLYDDGARPFGACNTELPDAERAFVETIVTRFRDYQHLVWLPTEEHKMKACADAATDVAKAEALATEIRLHDDVHPLGVHHNNGESNQYLGNTDIDVFAQQICGSRSVRSVDGIHDAGEWGEDVYVMAECHPWHKDLLASGDRTTLRRTFWASAMAGGYVLFYDAWEATDPTDEMLADLGRINTFMDGARFDETEPRDDLAAADTRFVLADPTDGVYLLWADDAPATMGVDGMAAGTYRLRWFDPVDGATVEQVVAVSDDGGSFPVPAELGDEAAVSIEPDDGMPTPTTMPDDPTPPDTMPPVTVPQTGDQVGYWMGDGGGELYGFGDAPDPGSVEGQIVATASTPDGSGLWVLTSDGVVHALAGGTDHGDVDTTALASGEIPATISVLPDGSGYWVFTDRGRAISFGAAGDLEDLVDLGIGDILNGPIIASVATRSGDGAYMIGFDGGVFAVGDAEFHGSMGGVALNGPVVGIATDADGVGYWLVADDGGIFSFEADFQGSMGGQPLNQPMVGAVPFGDGYLMVASDGGIFNFSNLPFLGSLGDDPPPNPVTAVTGFPS